LKFKNYIIVLTYKNRLFLIEVIVFTLISCLKDEPLKQPYSGFTPVDIGDEWILSSPSHENMDSIKLDEVFRYFYRENEFMLGRSMTIIRNGKIVAEAYSMEDKDIHQIQNIKSATKSFTGILACIALQNGILDSVNQRFSDIYPEYFENYQDKKEITIEQALTMRTGLVRDNKDDGYNFFMTKNTIEFALSSQRDIPPVHHFTIQMLIHNWSHMQFSEKLANRFRNLRMSIFSILWVSMSGTGRQVGMELPMELQI